MADTFLTKLTESLATRYSGVFGFADYKYEVSFSKFKIADLIWPPKIQNLKFLNFDNMNSNSLSATPKTSK